MSTAKIVSEQHTNPDMRSYHVNFELSRYPLHIFKRPLRESSQKYLTEVGERGTTLLKALFAIPGVNEVFIQPYEVMVERGKAFDWETIESRVMRELNRVASDHDAPQELGAEAEPVKKVSFQGWPNRTLVSLKETFRKRFSRK